MSEYRSVQQLIAQALEQGVSISQLVCQQQAKEMELTAQQIFAEMERRYQVMEESARIPADAKRSRSGLSGKDAGRYVQYCNTKGSLLGDFASQVVAKALAVAENNAAMGRIVAAPTAGSSGVLPAVLLTAEQAGIADRRQVVFSLFTAGAVGMVIAQIASVSGAQGGCQAECGAAAAMAAAALVELRGGDAQQVGHAVALALKSLMGLICDPVCGLVEVPCVKRNATAAMIALTSAELALAGVKSMIPVDEVIDAMRAVGQMMPGCLKETAQGGIAATPTAQALQEKMSAE